MLPVDDDPVTAEPFRVGIAHLLAGLSLDDDDARATAHSTGSLTEG